MFCIKCGQELPAEAIFCPYCGDKQPSFPIKKNMPDNNPPAIDNVNSHNNSLDSNGTFNISKIQGKNVLVKYYGHEDIVRIPDSIEVIGASAFSNCTSTIKVFMPDTVIEIGYRAFSGMTHLTHIRFSKNLRKIDWSAFSGCCSLKVLDLPPSLKEMGSYVFENCTDLLYVSIPPSLNGSFLFNGCTKIKTVFYPKKNRSPFAFPIINFVLFCIAMCMNFYYWPSQGWGFDTAADLIATIILALILIPKIRRWRLHKEYTLQ